jgi:hypothetical protein
MLMNYKALLDEKFEESKSYAGCETQIDFVGDVIFEFTTYDSNINELFTRKMIEVLKCILEKSNFQYQDASEGNYLNYLTMVNMPFLADKLEWGSSIRGAWFDEYGHHSEQQPTSYHIYNFEIPKKDITIFIKDLIEWVYLDNAPSPTAE